MKQGVVVFSVIPVRAGASEKSEMITQLLFGEHVEILQKRANWYRIRSLHDDYEGWADYRMIREAGEVDADAQIPKGTRLSELSAEIHPDDGGILRIPRGAYLPEMNGDRGFRLGGRQYAMQNVPQKPASEDIREMVCRMGREYLHTPYLWGGRSPWGIDCSGFIQVIYTLAGLAMPRDAYQQVHLGETICFGHDARAGDLAFFENKDGRIVHVGILLDDKQIIHASGAVRTDWYDHQGIFHREMKKYTHKLSVIKNLLG